MTQGQGLFKKFMCIRILVDKPSEGLRIVLPTAFTETPDLTASAAAPAAGLSKCFPLAGCWGFGAHGASTPSPCTT